MFDFYEQATMSLADYDQTTMSVADYEHATQENGRSLISADILWL